MTLPTPRPADPRHVILRGVVSLLVLLGLLIGIPGILLALFGSPLPSGIPSPDEISTGLMSRDNGTLFITLIEIITWLAWASFAVSCFAEAGAFLRGRQARSLPAMDGPQRLAAYLIASIALAFTATAANAASATGPAAAAAPRAPAAMPATQVQQQPDADQRIHVVKPGESMWGIAEDELGDGDRYKEIYKASKKLDQPPGIPKLTNPRVIHPGEHLVIPKGKPADKKKSPERQERPGQKAPTAPGELGPSETGDRSDGKSTPVATPSETAPATALPTVTPAPSSPAAADVPTTVTVSAEEADSAVPAVLYGGLAASGLVGLLAMKRLIQQRRRRPGHRIRMPDVMSDSEWIARITETPDDADLLHRSLRTLAKNICEAGGALPRIRGLKVVDRKVELFLEEEVPATSPTAPFRSTREGTLLLDPHQVLTEDELGEGPAPYPTLVTLGSSGDRASVLVDLEVVGAVGLVGTPAETVEVLTAAAVDLATSRLADHMTVLCVGFVPELPAVLSSGRLRHVSTVAEALDDVRNHAREVAESLDDAELSHALHARTALAAEGVWNPVVVLSALSCDADQLTTLQSLVSGHGSLGAIVRMDLEADQAPAVLTLSAASNRLVDLPGVSPVVLHRVTAPSYEELLDDFTVASDVESVPNPRWHDVPPEPEDLRHHLASPDDSPEPALLPAPAPLKKIPDEEIPGRQSPQGLDSEGIEALPETSGVSTHAAEDESDQRLEDSPSDPYIRVLGRIEVQGRDVSDLEPGKRGLLVELAVYLRLSESPSAEELSRAMGGGRGPWSASTRVSNLSRLRAWLGTNADGKNYVPTQRNRQTYSIENGVACDWTDFEHVATEGLKLVAAGDPETAERYLHLAFSMVKGRPFASASPERYVWAEFLKQEMIAGIVDVAHVLALVHIDAGRFLAARAVITKGLDIEPGSELLYRDWFLAEHKANNRQGLNAAAERLLRTLHDLGVEMEPETAELLDDLLRDPFKDRL